jgi:hypothetical protein
MTEATRSRHAPRLHTRPPARPPARTLQLGNLNLFLCRAGDEGAAQLAAGLAGCPLIHTLNLGYNGIGGPGFAALFGRWGTGTATGPGGGGGGGPGGGGGANCLQNPSLSSLHVGNNHLCAGGAARLCAFLRARPGCRQVIATRCCLGQAGGAALCRFSQCPAAPAAPSSRTEVKCEAPAYQTWCYFHPYFHPKCTVQRSERTPNSLLFTPLCCGGG